MGLLTYIRCVFQAPSFTEFPEDSSASGLLYVSELIEEHSRVAKVYGQRGIYAIIALHFILYFSESLPLAQTAFSIVCHIVYLQNFSASWPLISLTSSSFLASCVFVVADHFLWFFYFSRITQEARQSRAYRHTTIEVPGFTEIASFFGICVWLAPLFLFLSLSANDNALPVSAAEPGSPTNGTSSMHFAQTRVSLFRSIFSLDSLPLFRPKGTRRAEGLLASHSPTPPQALSHTPPSPTASRHTTIPPPPRSPGFGKTHESDGFLSPSSGFTLNNPPRQSAPARRQTRGRPSRTLVFRTGETASQAVVEFLPQNEIDLTNAVRLTNRVIKGCLGLISVENALITSATEVGNTRPSGSKPETVAKIHEVSFFSLTSATWDDLSAAPEVSLGLDGPEGVANREYSQTSTAPPVFEHPCMPLTKILSSGSFYYALESPWDLSSRLAIRLARDASFGAYDERFVWNEYIVRSLLDFRDRLDPHERTDFDRCQFIVNLLLCPPLCCGLIGSQVLAIQGYVGVYTMSLPAPPTNGAPMIATLAVISRLGWKRAGTRFNTRGVDDDGNTANFVETETVFSTDQHCVSYVQVRGSVPLFWEQQGLQTFGQRIQITRPHASQPAFERHFSHLMDEYGAIHAINLLGTKENEQSLTTAYGRHLHIAREAIGDDLSMTHFDFHNAVRIGGHDSVIRDLRRLEAIVDHVDRFGFTMCNADTDEIITDQKGVFRTNCLDCLDRTNFVQDILSRTTLEQYLLLVRREWIQSNTLWAYHRELWAENGDALSRIYAGTGALNTSYTRSGKRTLAGVLSDATKSVSRAYINNFQDKGKQVAIDMFLGNLSTQRAVTIFDPVHDSVRAALEQRLGEYSTTKQATIFTGTWNLNGRIVQTDPDKRRIWEKQIFETLDRRPNKKCNYVLLRSEQLVGTALVILVKSELLSTGLRGMSGNKGAVGIRLEYHDTSFCFLTAHLAAGHSNVEERNADYRTIAHGLHFQRGKTIPSHDNVIWLGDMNYRIDMENFTVRGLAERNELDALLAADQLKQVMDEGEAFSGYLEGPILFRPTYRYDLGTDVYDTSEKLRIPAWTVFGIFRAEVRIIDPVKKLALSRLLLNSITSTIPGEQLNEKLAALVFPSDITKLPPPSSDEVAWWNGPGGVLPLHEFQRILARRKTNPFDSPDDSPLSSSPSSSDEELYTDALSLPTPMAPTQAPRKPPPPPPPRSTKPTTTTLSTS
ncbi:hypothetical protein DXG01_005651 [Tephrocybe rancida]|nr:hypothetical protein DXG01_005651 [Tephrocybe rancida]